MEPIASPSARWNPLPRDGEGQSAAASWSANQSAGPRAVDSWRSRAAWAARSSAACARRGRGPRPCPPHRTARPRPPPRPPRPTRPPRATGTAPVALVDDGPFLRHQVQAVADRVHQQGVGSAQHRHGPGVVVSGVVHDRGPAGGRPALVDLLDQRLDVLLVLDVRRHAGAGRVDGREEHHPLAPLGMSLEEQVERLEAAQQVLGQLDAVDPGDDQPVADRFVDLGQRGRAGGGGGRSRRSSAAAGSGETKVRGVRPCTSRHDDTKSPAQRAVWNPQARGRRGPTRPRRPRAAEAPAARWAWRRACGGSGRPRGRGGSRRASGP